MNKKDEIKIEVLSQIDDDIIEKQTKKRFALMTGKPRKNHRKMVSVLGAAAAFVLICSIFLGILLPMLFKQIPVYEGMTISNTAPSASMEINLDRLPTLLSRSDPYGLPMTQLLVKGHEKPADNRLDKAPEIVKENRSLYYAKKNEDIYVTVHINNPEDFEILSFTLNGFKYQSYMFEDGSDSENLILKINVGDTEGMVDYTIDAIKYVDGTQIKDVRMVGDRTVRVAVYPENQPTAEFTNRVISETEIRFDLLVNDEKSLIKESDGEVYVALYEGETAVSKQTAHVGEKHAIVFSDLTPGVAYRYEVVANYDSLDGYGYGAYVLAEQSFQTKSHIVVNNLSVLNTTITFDLDIAEDKNVVVQRIELLSDGIVVAEGDAGTRRFENVWAGQYMLRIIYSYSYNGLEKTGYAFYRDVTAVVMGPLDRIVHDAIVVKEYTIDTMHIWNETTQTYRSHSAVDLKPGGSDMGVYAAVGGKVSLADPITGQVTIDTGNGKLLLYYRSLDTILVSEGQTVVAGQQIGTVGTTFRLEKAEEPHLCLAMAIDGHLVDPEIYFY